MVLTLVHTSNLPKKDFSAWDFKTVDLPTTGHKENISIGCASAEYRGLFYRGSLGNSYLVALILFRFGKYSQVVCLQAKTLHRTSCWPASLFAKLEQNNKGCWGELRLG